MKQEVASSSVRATVLAVAAIVLAMVSVQSGAAIAKTLFGAAGPQAVTAMRTVFAALLLGVVLRPWRGAAPRGAAWLAATAYGASLGWMNLLFYLAIARLPLGLAVAIEFLGPCALALVLSRRPVDLLWVLLAIGGLSGLLSIGQVSTAIDPYGALFALGAGACWAFYIIFGRTAGRHLPGGRAVALGMAVAAVVTLPFGVAGGGALLHPAVLGPGLVVAVLSSAVPYPLEMVALRRLPARTFGILMSLEPALAALSGLVLLDETLDVLQWAAILSVVAASLGSTLTARR